MKLAMYAVLGLVSALALVFILNLAGVGMFVFFEPIKEDARREVFENTKSYIHGKTHDLAKYFEEYNKADSIGDKEAVASLIKMNFSDFDESKIRSDRLKRFLVSVRGY